MKTKKIPFVGLYLHALAFICVLVAYILSIRTFNIFGYDVDRFVLILPIFAMWLLVVQVVMSYIDKDKPIWTNVIDLFFCVLLVFAFAKLLIPFLTPIGIFFSVNMGDMATYALGVPRCIAGCVLYVVASILFIVSAFFNIWKTKEAK